MAVSAGYVYDLWSHVQLSHHVVANEPTLTTLVHVLGLLHFYHANFACILVLICTCVRARFSPHTPRNVHRTAPVTRSGPAVDKVFRLHNAKQNGGCVGALTQGG
jgi:hypothetical protein